MTETEKQSDTVRLTETKGRDVIALIGIFADPQQSQQSKTLKSAHKKVDVSNERSTEKQTESILLKAPYYTRFKVFIFQLRLQWSSFITLSPKLQRSPEKSKFNPLFPASHNNTWL